MIIFINFCHFIYNHCLIFNQICIINLEIFLLKIIFFILIFNIRASFLDYFFNFK